MTRRFQGYCFTFFAVLSLLYPKFGFSEPHPPKLASKFMAHGKGALKARKERQCVRKTMSLLGIHKMLVSDPILMQDVFEGTMHLGDFKRARRLVGASLFEPVSFAPMVRKIRRGIFKQHPELRAFLCQALDQGLIEKVGKKGRQQVKRALHHTYLLEILTVEMAKNTDFMVEMTDYLLRVRESYGIEREFIPSVNTLYKASNDIFLAIKTKTMDWVFTEYDRIRSRGYFLPAEEAARKAGLNFNILEAAIAESTHQNSYRDNAIAGVALMVNPPSRVRVTSPDSFIEYVNTKKWNSLYHSWNLAFMTGNVSHLHILYPKLFIPSVVNAKPHDYLFNRALALWVSINFHLFAKINNEADDGIPNKEKLTKLWGKVNLGFGEKLVVDNQVMPASDFKKYAENVLKTTYLDLWQQLGGLLMRAKIIDQDDYDALAKLIDK